MADPAPAATSRGKYLLDHRFSIDGGAIELQLDSTRDRKAIQAILRNDPLPPGEYELGAIAVGTPDRKPIKLGHQAGNLSVEFGFSGHFGYEMAVFSAPSATLAALSPEHEIAAGLALTGNAGERYLLVKLGYDVGATAKGAVALGGGLSAIFSGSGAHSGEWGIIHRFSGEGADDVLRTTFNSWCLPSQFDGPQRLAPGTWMVAEVDGSFELNLGIEAGHEFNWVRTLPGGLLRGDVGLKVALAASAVLGFSASGNYAVALSRPDDSHKIGLTVYRLSHRGASFTFSATAGAASQLPAVLLRSRDPLALVTAICGTHYSQLLDDLSLARAAALGEKPVEQAAKFLIGLGKREMAATGLADSEYYNRGLVAAQALVQASAGAGAGVTSLLSSLAARGLDAGLQPLSQVLSRIRDAGVDLTALTGVIHEQLAHVDFFQSDFGRWLAAVVRTTPHAALADPAELQSVCQAAGKTLALIESAAFRALIGYAQTELKLDFLHSKDPAPPFTSLDGWLQHKIAALLGKAVPNVVQTDVDALQQSVRELVSKCDQFYATAIKAAQRKAESSFKAAYQGSTSRSALLDVVFDFDANAGLLPYLQAAIAGHFDRLLLDPGIAGITLRSAVLTHGTERSQKVELSMPFFDAAKDNITTTLASLAPHDDGNGRVLAYDVGATSEISAHVLRRSQRDSTLALSLSSEVPLPGVHVHPGFHASLGYSLRSATAETSRRCLAQTLGPVVDTYGKQLLPQPATFDGWLDSLEQQLGAVGGRGMGPSLTTLDVSVPGGALGVWLQAPADAGHRAYRSLSLKLQRRLRDLVSAVYFSDVRRYETTASAYPAIAYASLQELNSFDTTNDTVPPVHPTDDDYYWNCADMQHIRAAVATFSTRHGIETRLAGARQQLLSLASPAAEYYKPECVGAVQTAALRRSDGAALPALLSCLLFAEARTIRGAVHAGTEAAAFRSAAAGDPRKALAMLSSFSADVVDTFHGIQGGQPFTDDELTMLGSALFSEATMALAEALGGEERFQPSAALNLTFFDPQAGLTPADLLAGKFTAGQVRLPQALPPA